MGTTMYLEKQIVDSVDRENTLLVEVGTSTYGGDGPQMYIKFGDHSLLLSHEDAREFANAIDSVASYFGYRR